MDKTEKIIGAVFIIVVVVWLSCFIYSIKRIGDKIDHNGGIKQVIIDVGKEIKDIKRQIETD